MQPTQTDDILYSTQTKEMILNPQQKMRQMIIIFVELAFFTGIVQKYWANRPCIMQTITRHT